MSACSWSYIGAGLPKHGLLEELYVNASAPQVCSASDLSSEHHSDIPSSGDGRRRPFERQVTTGRLGRNCSALASFDHAVRTRLAHLLSFGSSAALCRCDR